MMLDLRGLGVYQVEGFEAAVADEMEALGFGTRMRDAEGPDVSVCMFKPGKPELCTDLRESGTPWAIYSPSNIANLQAERYGIMYEGVEPPGSQSQAPATAQYIPPVNYTMGLRFVNTTTGNASLVRVGDSWTLEVSGPPNSDVLSVGGPGGQRNRTVLGRTNSAGAWNTSGRMTANEIGTWVQDFSVGGVAVGQLAFVVEAVQAEKPRKQTVSETLEEKAKQEIVAPNWMESLTSNPLLLVGGAAVVLFLVMGRGK